VSCSPAKLASGLSSIVALDRTATWPAPSPAYADVISAATPGGSGTSVTRARMSAAAPVIPARSSAGSDPSARRVAPDGSAASRCRPNAATMTT